VIHNGIGPCDISDPDEKLVQFAGSHPLVVCIAALRPQKQVDVFIDAAPRILSADSEVRMAVIGDGELGPQLRDRARLQGLADQPRFAFFGFESPAERYLARADIYVLPSSWEGFPLGVLEALACGVPQVVTDVGGTREAISAETGLLVSPRNPRAIADAVVSLLQDPARLAAMQTASRARHARLFTTDRMVAATAEVYDLVAGGLPR
jgi:glycosyltransferase involved in cell wall biosynthesis